MPEMQHAATSGEMTQKFIEFVMMQAQQAALFLGRIPNPQTGKPEVNLDVARMFIDQLEMIREKTRGNLTNEESEILTRVLSDLQLTFVQATGSNPPVTQAAEVAAPPSISETPQVTESPGEPSTTPSENRKKFTKSYGS